MSTIFNDEVFFKAFKRPEISKLNPTEMDSYQSSLKIFRDNKAVFDYAVDTAFNVGKFEGKLEGKFEGKFKIAKNAKQIGSG